MINQINTQPPNCRCSDCILHPEDSHGIHAIGVYSPPARLSRRGGRITEESVSYYFPTSATGGSGVKVPLVAASGVRYILNF